MIITKAEVSGKRVLPGTEDRRVAARTSSLVCWLAALWFFVSPWAYFGASEERGGWNAWIVGGLMVVAAMIRLVRPQGTSGFSIVNVVLSVWVLISPFLFGYSSHVGRLINSLSVGAIVLAFSLLSLLITKDVKTRIGTSDEWEHDQLQNDKSAQ